MKDNKGLTRITLIMLVIAIILVVIGVILVYMGNSNNSSGGTSTSDSESALASNMVNTNDDESKKIPEDAITDDFKINGYSYSSINNSSEYECDVYAENSAEDNTYYSDEEGVTLTEVIAYSLVVDISEFDLPTCLFDYVDEVRLRITYDESDYTVYDCKVVNYLTGEVIEDTSEENIIKLFDIEYDKEIIEEDWTDTINLSDIEENNIYKYTATETTQFPEIVNDTDYNCIIYIKEYTDETYEKEINMYNSIESLGLSISYNEYEESDSFNIMYVIADTEKLMKYIDEEDIIYLSDYSSGDQLTYSFEEYVYNDTEYDINISIQDSAYGIENTETYTVKAGEIYEFDWMVDSASIEY